MEIILSDKQLDRLQLRLDESKSISQYVWYGGNSAWAKKYIETEGRRVFNRLIEDPTLRKFLDEVMESSKHDIELKTPDILYLQKNLEDIDFVLNNLPLRKKQKDYLKEKKVVFQEYLRKRKVEDEEEFEDAFTLEDDKGIEIKPMFFEKGEWSLINKFDNNISLWVDTMKRILTEYQSSFRDLIEEGNWEEVIKKFFNEPIKPNSSEEGDKLTFAELGLLENMSLDLENATKIVHSKTERGDFTENKFIDHLYAASGANEFNMKNFASKGGVIDMLGIDLAIKISGDWIPVQIKSNKGDAERFIPYRGISIFPENNKFYFTYDKKQRSKNFKIVLDQ
jgi:hypothetical protein